MAAPRIVLSICVVALALVGSATAEPTQQSAGESQDSALESIDRTLREIADLLRVQLGNQRAELAVRRLDIASRDLVARERELYDAEVERDGYVRDQEQLKVSVEQFSDFSREDSGMTEAQLENAIEQMNVRAEEVKRSFYRAEQRVIDLRKEITRVREDLATWEEIVAASFVTDGME